MFIKKYLNVHISIKTNNKNSETIRGGKNVLLTKKYLNFFLCGQNRYIHKEYQLKIESINLLKENNNFEGVTAQTEISK